MTSIWRGIGLIAAAALLVGGIATNQVYAQASSTTGQQTDTKQKSTEKKKDAAKETQTQTQTNSGKSAPMSGFRPDPQSNY